MKQQTRSMIFAALFTALTAFGAFIQIPIPPYPVPMTLQTMFLFLAGLLLEKRAALLSQVTYVVLGLIGIPVFTRGGGIGYIFDATFGYLLGFILFAPMLRLIAEKTLYQGKRFRYWSAGIALVVLLQLIGVGYMALIAAFYTKIPLSFERAIYLIVIFIPLDILKLSIATLLATQLRGRLPHVFQS
ncbi:biotin transporter BioY [Christensenellaceae bacterium OttesenSCG-928-L17]|nr:biotin transporter BioY [Christensenellaceae bacterium OttesenSCG-928-L17]